MADFSAFRARRRAFDHAAQLVDRVLAVYSTSAAVRDILATYQAGTDAALNAAIDATFTGPQKTELGQIAALMATLATSMETDHAGVLGLL
jgi:hypothetical protein